MSQHADFRWGILGLGNVASARFAPAVAGAPGVALVGCSARDPVKAQDFAQKFGVAHVHDTFDAMLADPAIDGVYIATPNSLHVQHAGVALRAGKHVLCEKPLALSEADGAGVVTIARSVGRVLGIAFQMRFEPVFRRAREIIASGRLGEIRTIAFLGCSPAGVTGTWRQAPEEGGVLSDLAVHLIDLLPWLTRMDYTRLSACANPPDIDRDPVRTISVLATLGAGCHAFVQASREIVGGQQSLLVEGTHGSLWCPAWRGAAQVELVTRDASGEKSEPIAGPPAFSGLVSAFVAATRGEATALASGADGVRSIVLADAIRRAARDGVTVAIPPCGTER